MGSQRVGHKLATKHHHRHHHSQIYRFADAGEININTQMDRDSTGTELMKVTNAGVVSEISVTKTEN